MKTYIHQLVGYSYHELSDEAKKNTKGWYLEHVIIPEAFVECVMAELRQLGLHHLNIDFYFGHNPGDGFFIDGTILKEEIFNDAFKDIALKGFGVPEIISIKKLQHVTLKRTDETYLKEDVLFDFNVHKELTRIDGPIFQKLVDNIEDWYNRFCDTWEKHGYAFFDRDEDMEVSDLPYFDKLVFQEDGTIIQQTKYKEIR